MTILTQTSGEIIKVSAQVMHGLHFPECLTGIMQGPLRIPFSAFLKDNYTCV